MTISNTETSSNQLGSPSILGSGAIRPVVKISNLSKKFASNGPVIIDNLNLEVREGEFVSLVGASGCGKSTLLNILSGLDTASSGSVELAEQSTLMFQESALLPWLTAGKNIELALKLSGHPKEGRKARAQELLELVHLPNAYNQRPHELSGGMRQCVAIARALSQGRKILLMDEPLSNLDPPHQADWLIWQRELLAQGKTLVTVLHEIQYALRADHIVMIKQGNLHFEGASNDPATHQALIELFEGRIRLEKLGNEWVSLPA